MLGADMTKGHPLILDLGNSEAPRADDRVCEQQL